MRKLLFPHRMIVTAVVMLFLNGSALAEAESDAGWDWRLTPMYYWSLNMGGSQSAGSGPPIDTDDYEFKFEGALSANFEGTHNDRWGFVADLIWVDLSNSNKTNDSRMDFSYLQAQLDGYYRTRFGRQSVDWLAGVRYYDSDFQLSPAPIGGEKAWADPLVGARWRWSVSDPWSLEVRGDVGGFGIGSELSWQVLALADWQPWTHVSLTGGFRALGIDFSDGNGADAFDYDLTMWGPLLGVSIKW
jgi:hypothetical protein